MNLFENLQKLNESENPLINEFKEFLASKNAQCIYDELGETKDGMQIVIHDGDYKHEHRYMRNLINEFFENKGMNISININTEPSDQDTYTATYDIIFNAKPKEYKVDVKTEDINNIRYQVTCQLATSNNDIYSEHSTLKDAIASARKAQQSFTNVKIKDLSDGSSWSDIDNAEQDLKDGIVTENSFVNKESNNDVDTLIDKAGGVDYVHEIINDTKDAYPGIDDTDEIADMSYSYVEDKMSFEEWSSVIEYLCNSLMESININLNEYEYIGPATGYNKGWSLYRKIVDGKGEWVAEHQQTKEVVPINYDQVQGFEPIKNTGINKLQKDLGDMLLPKRESNNTISVEYTYDGDDVSDYKGHIKVSTDNEEAALNVAKKYIKNNYPDINPRNFTVSNDNYNNVDVIDINGKKLTESNDEDYDDNAATFLDTLEKEVKEAAHEFMLSVGFPEDEADDYLSVSTDINDDYVMIAVGAELEYDSLFNLCQTLDEVIAKHDEDAYFEPECPGRIVAYLFGEKAKNAHKEKEQTLKNKINSLDKVEETNHNIIENKDYHTGEKIFNELLSYLQSIDQVDMDGNDYNWDPSEFNAKNLNADGEIYLVSGAYILVYPYINEWAEDYFKVSVIGTDELNVQIKNKIENIFNKFKTDNWKLIFED